MPQYRIVFGLPDATLREFPIEAHNQAEAKNLALSLRKENEAVLVVEQVSRGHIHKVPEGYTFVDAPFSNVEISLYELYKDATGESESDEIDVDESDDPLDDPVIPEMWDELSALLRGLAG